MSNRISIGFHRVGLLAGFIIFVLFAGVLIMQSITNEYSSVSIWHFLVVIIFAFVAYVSCRLIGWVISGFAKN